VSSSKKVDFTKTQKRRPCEEGDRDWNYVTLSWSMGEARENPPPEPAGGKHGNTVI
jgi:hypothetical protein